MFEFTVDLGPLHLALRIGEPATAGDEYAALYADTELADTTGPDIEVDFRG
jgi:hypothetical protein